MVIEKFVQELSLLYKEIINENCNSAHIKAFKEKWGVQNSIGEVYQGLCKKELKKDMGSFYTPYEVFSYMTEKALDDLDYGKNPYVKVLDPSCGGGYFLTHIFKELRKKAQKAGIKNAHEHIIKYNIHGCDTDEIAVMLSVIELYELSGAISRNIKFCDYLFDYEGDFDIIIGNPPYMGHKIIDMGYREKLCEKFKEVFYDKADISYCFIKKSIDNLKKSGRLFFFTSRYLLEAQNGDGVRSYLLNNGFIHSLIDFYGVRVVKGAGVDNIILEYEKNYSDKFTNVYRLKQKADGLGTRVFEDIENKDYKYVNYIRLEYKSLSPEGFVFLSEREIEIINRIKGIPLCNISESYQGVITGCDKAFVINEKDVRELGIEKDLLMPWIKGKNIEPFKVTGSSEYLIYSNLINDIKEYKRAAEYIGRYHDRLINRRECRTGARQWYRLQWGRKLEMFMAKKIIFPYKASNNRFAIDYGNCFSADVYAIKLKVGYEQSFSHEYLVGVLNSSLYEFYIKSIAKKLGNDLYEYYPNKIMTLLIPPFIPEIEQAVKSGGEGVREKVDAILNQKLGITDEEFEVIRKWRKET